MQQNNYDLLLFKLDKFIRKYYFNKLIRGVLFSTALLIAFFLIIAFAEYQFYFAPTMRKFLFFGFVFISVILLINLVLTPILKIQKLGKIISHHQAAEIIGFHFVDIKDKLINILQLNSANYSLEQAALVEASIYQKSLELKPIPFTSAIDLNENRQYLKYAIPPLLLFFSILLFKPNIIKDSTNRIIKNDIVFEKPMPFKFIIDKKNLTALQFDDFVLNIKIEGEEIPNEIFLYRKTENNNYTKVFPQKLNATNYLYIFSNLQKDVKFYFEASGYSSKNYLLEISEKPLITNFLVELKYPKYLNKKNSVLKNIGDISAPFGTSVNWIFEAIATEKINIAFSDASFNLIKGKNNQFIHSKSLTTNDKYIIKTLNNNVKNTDSLEFSISVVFDEFPKISVKEHQDSSNSDVLYYLGEISDDHGLTNLTFNYKIENKEKPNINNKIISKKLEFEKNTISSFTYFWNIKSLNLQVGDKLTYHFTVWDNDGVNGSKFSQSKKYNIEIPSLSEFEEKSDKDFNKIKKDLVKSIEKSQKLQKKMREFKNKLLNKKELSWEDKKKMKEMLKEQKDLQNKISEMNEKLKDNIKEQTEFKKIDSEIAKKQEQIQKLFDEVLDEEMKKLIEKYEKMLEELNKEDVIDQTDEMQVTDEELEKELDRMLEMLKKIEFEQKLNELEEKLKKLAEKQEKLNKNKDLTKDEQIKEQEKLNKEFDKLKDDLKNLDKLDEELGDKANMEAIKEDSEKISEEMSKSSESLSKNQKNKASDSQKSSAQKMNDLAKKLSDMAIDMQSESLEEDMKALRQLLENLITLSFEQEHLIDDFKTTSINTPKYVSLVKDQHKLIENSQLVEDSLFALAKRVIQIESFIIDKMFEINRNLDVSVKELEDRKVFKATVNQQYIMTGYNDLALMLSEIMQQMQEQMAKQKPGNQTCEKPGGKKPKPGKIPSLKQMQQQLSKQIDKMGKEIKEGESGKKRGEKSSQSKELAKMAAKQQAIREALQKIQKEDQKNGKSNLGDLQKLTNQMKQSENDLVNKSITNELLERQKEILTKLLEAENAEKQRDEKEERKSTIALDYNKETPSALKKYLNTRKGSLSIYNNLPIKLKPYYKTISEKYFKNSIYK